MRLAISNIAWDVTEDEQVASLLKHYCIDAIDIAPGKYFPVPAKARNSDIHRMHHWWQERGIEITGMQALLFGTLGLNVFGDIDSQNAMLAHLSSICHIGGELGATRLVFGSPRNRDRTGLSDEEALDISSQFFSRLGDVAQSNGVFICLEPNPSCYGANFMTTSRETALVVETISHPAIKMQLDTGALTVNGEEPETILQNFSHLIGHIHASEPELLPIGDGVTEHTKVFESLSKLLPDYIVSVEMVATNTEPHLVSIKRALKHAITNYRPDNLGVVA